MTEGETKANAPTDDEDFNRRDEALEQEIKEAESTLPPKPPKIDHARDGGVI